jgi:ribA/ribD-fused uncharacterized protein
MVVNEFQGEYRWLSNFWPCEVEFEGVVYHSVENAYQAAKFHPWEKERKEMEHCTPGRAKSLAKGRSRPMKHEELMLDLVRKKFKRDALAVRLIATGSAYLQEGNRWGDTYWGVDLRAKSGFNKLGFILMKVRDELKK